MKIVVFDLDETLGYFTEYGIFWGCLSNYLKIKNKIKLTQADFNTILDLYPEFLRPNILDILNYLKDKKQNKCCNKMMIYTNNQGPKEWAYHIIEYFENRINHKLFDQIISAFKVNGKIVEICRTTNDKTHKDLIKCSRLPSNSEICFLDDNFYPEMVHENIYYINVKPYMYDLKFEDMINRFLNSRSNSITIEDKNDFNKFMMSEYKKYNYHYSEKNPKEYEIDNILSKQIIIHLQEFFDTAKINIKNNAKTKRNYTHKKNKTKRRY
jgi:hypothetical protein